MRMSDLRRAAAVMALLAGIPCWAVAAALKPGLYDINATQEICLQAAGTWYSPTLANWTGQWVVAGVETHIFGNYNAGSVNDSIVVHGKKGSWTEWSDSLSFQKVFDPIAVKKVGQCS
jgi:hypothetical protein